MMATACLLAGLMQSDELNGALKKLSESKNYAWKGSVKFEGGVPGGQEIPEAKFEGAYDEANGTRFLTDTNEYLKVGEKLVTRPRAEWRLVDPDAQGRGRGMGRMFGGVPKAPHEEVKDAGGKISDPEKAAAKEKVGDVECAVYTAKLKDEAARGMTPMGRMIERMGDAEVTGTVKVWIGPDGRVVKYQATVKVAASVQGNDFEMTTIRTTSIQDEGKAKVEIPEDAKKAMQGPRKDY